MVSNSKEDSEPSLFGLFFVGSFFAAIGAIIGFFYMASFEMQSYANLEEFEQMITEREVADLRPSDAFFIRQARVYDTSWQAKRDSFLNGSTTELPMSYGEMNAWIANRIKPPTLAPGESKGIVILPGVPSFASMHEDRVYFNIPVRGKAYGRDFDLRLSGEGLFPDAEGALFSVEWVQVNGAPIPFAPIVGKPLLRQILRAYEGIEEYRTFVEAWNQVEIVTVDRAGLSFQF